MSFDHKWLKFEFELGAANGTFPNGTTTQPVDGFRASVKLDKAGGISMVTASVTIFGLSMDLMQKLTKLGAPVALNGVNSLNQITIYAGSKEGGLPVVYKGAIYQAWANITDGPDASFELLSQGGMVDALTPAPPTSVKGGADVATLMGTLASQMNGGVGYNLEPNGVTTQISSPYLCGGLRDQAYQLAQAAGCYIDIDNDTLAIWPKGTARSGGPYEISVQTGMAGYPAFTDQGIFVRTLFNPSIKFGAQINVTSIIVPACGLWNIYQVTHELDSNTVDGKWFTDISGSLLGHPLPTLGG